MTKRNIVIFFIAAIAVSVVVKLKISESNQMNYKGIQYYQVYSLNKPDTLFFCNERVPVDIKKVSDKVSKEIYHFNYLRKRTNIIIKRVNYWFPIIEKILEQHKIPNDFKYLAVVESGLANVVSPRNAAGFWQFMPNTARSKGLVVNEEIDERFDPIKATHATCRYLKSAYKQLGNWTNVAASYNMGISGMKRQLRVQRQKSYYKVKLNNETGRYVYKIIALKEIIENQQKYGFKPLKISFPAHNLITITEPIEDLNVFATEHATSLELLQEFNPWIKGSSLTIDKKYFIKIPKEKLKTKKKVDEKVILDSIKPTGFKKDNIKEAVEKAEEEAKKTLYLESPEDTTLGS